MDSINKNSLLEKRLIVAFHLSHSINLISATSKSFSPVHTIKSVGLQDLYLHSFDMFLKTVSLNMDSESRILLQIAIRMLLHRLIVCLDEEEMVPLLPNAIQTLFLSSNEITAKSLQELVPLFSQIVPKYKHSWLFQRDILPFIGQIFSPLILLFFNLYTSAGSESEKFSLQKSYYVFMNIIFTSNLIPSFFDLGKCSRLFVLFEFPVTICTCFLQKRNWLKKYSVHWWKARSITPTVKFSEYATRLWPNWSKSMVWLPRLTSVKLIFIFSVFSFSQRQRSESSGEAKSPEQLTFRTIHLQVSGSGMLCGPVKEYWRLYHQWSFYLPSEAQLSPWRRTVYLFASTTFTQTLSFTVKHRWTARSLSILRFENCKLKESAQTSNSAIQCHLGVKTVSPDYCMSVHCDCLRRVLFNRWIIFYFTLYTL